MSSFDQEDPARALRVERAIDAARIPGFRAAGERDSSCRDNSSSGQAPVISRAPRW